MPRTEILSIDLDEVSTVPSGDNPEAAILLWKSERHLHKDDGSNWSSMTDDEKREHLRANHAPNGEVDKMDDQAMTEIHNSEHDADQKREDPRNPADPILEHIHKQSPEYQEFFSEIYKQVVKELLSTKPRRGKRVSKLANDDDAVKVPDKTAKHAGSDLDDDGDKLDDGDDDEPQNMFAKAGSSCRDFPRMGRSDKIRHLLNIHRVRGYSGVETHAMSDSQMLRAHDASLGRSTVHVKSDNMFSKNSQPGSGQMHLPSPNLWGADSGSGVSGSATDWSGAVNYSMAHTYEDNGKGICKNCSQPSDAIVHSISKEDWDNAFHGDKCPNCKGSCYVTSMSGGVASRVLCPECGGSGIVPGSIAKLASDWDQLTEIKDEQVVLIGKFLKEVCKNMVTSEDIAVVFGKTISKDLSQSERDAIDDSDFAGPHRSFPIDSQEHLNSAAKLIGHADDPAAVKSKAISIARRKGYSLPDSWQDGSDVSKMASVLEGPNMFEKANKRVLAFSRMTRAHQMRHITDEHGDDSGPRYPGVLTSLHQRLHDNGNVDHVHNAMSK